MNFAPLLQDSTTTTGTGNITTVGAAVGFQSLTAIGEVGATFDYTIRKDGSAEWEEGVGTLLTATTFSRAPTASSNGGALVSFSAGTRDVVIGPTAARAKKLDAGTSARLVFASSLLVSDTDLSFESNTSGTPQHVAAQSLLDLAIAGPLILVWDVAVTVGMASSTTSLRIRSNTKVMALPGCGAKFAPDCPVGMWRNYNVTINPANIVDKNIEIYGGIWHGNSANQSLRETAANGGTSIMDFIGVKKLRITGPHMLWRARGFAWRGTNVYNVDIEDGTVEFESGNGVVSTDGYHFNGPASHITMRNLRLNYCADDAIALNADDAWVAAGANGGPYASWGAITDVTIQDIYLKGTVCGIRLLSGQSRIDRIKIGNVQGSTSGYWLIIDSHVAADTTLSGPGNIGCVEIDGVNMENTVPTGGWFQAQAHVNCKVEQISFRNVSKSKFNNVLYPAVVIGTKADIGQFGLHNYKSRSSNGGTYLTNQLDVRAGAKVALLRVEGCDFHADTTNTGSPINIASGATVDHLVGIGNTGKNFASFVSNQGIVTNNNFAAASNFMTAGSTSSWVLDAGFSETSATEVSYTGKIAAVQVARKSAVDTFSANIQLGATVKFTGSAGTPAHNAALLVRGGSLQPWSGNTRFCYCLDLNKTSGQLTLQRSDAGGDAVLGGGRLTVSGGFVQDAEYRAWLTAKLSALAARIQRVSDNLYLQANGSWGASAVDCITATDSTYSAGGGLQYGLYAYTGFTDGIGVTYTNVAAIAAP